MSNTLKALTVASWLTIATAPQVASAQDTTSSEVISICSEEEKLANREQKWFFMKSLIEIEDAVKNTKNPNIEFIEKPDVDWNESESSNVELEVKKEKTDVAIPLEAPVDIDGRKYNGIRISYNQELNKLYSWFYNLFNSWFYNIKQDDVTIVGFPMIVFTFSTPNNSGTSLCQEHKYFDEVGGYNFKTWEIEGRSIEFDFGKFKRLIEVALEELRR